MIGILLISHGDMAKGMISSASMLYPDIAQVDALGLMPQDNPDDFQVELEKKVAELDTGQGVYILCDLMGGTPGNRAAYVIGDKVRLLAGMSLPMLLALLFAREGTDDFDEITETVLLETRNATVDVYAIFKEKGIIK